MVASKILIEWDEGELRQKSSRRFVVKIFGNDDVDESATMAEAISYVGDYGEYYEGGVAYALPLERLWGAADEADVSRIFPLSRDGWVRLEHYWVPSYMDPESGAFERQQPIYEARLAGARADVYEWEGLFILCWSGPEGVDSGWEVLGRLNRTDAVQAAESKVDEFCDEWGFDYDPFLGLRNLSPMDEFEVPRGAVPWRSYVATSEYLESVVGDLTVYQLHEDGRVRLLVTVTDSTAVIGEYETEEDLEDNLGEEGGIYVDVNDL